MCTVCLCIVSRGRAKAYIGAGTKEIYHGKFPLRSSTVRAEVQTVLDISYTLKGLTCLTNNHEISINQSSTSPIHFLSFTPSICADQEVCS